MRLLALLAVAAVAAGNAHAAAPPPEFVQAVEFPYYLTPPNLWARELAWLKSLGVQTVEFPIPWNWHEVKRGEYDFNGRTSPRRDLAGFIRLLRRLGMRAWVRPLPPVPGWLNAGWPAGGRPGPAAQREWLQQLGRLLETQTASHGGPVAYVEGGLEIDAPVPPAPVAAVSATDPSALARSREILTANPAGPRGSLLWKDVEDALYPAGWAADPATLLRRGAVSLSGRERVSTGPLRRSSALLRSWAPLVPRLRRTAMPKPAAGQLPEGLRAIELVSPAGSAVAVSSAARQPFQGDLPVRLPYDRRTLILPGLTVAPGESLWLPIHVSLGPDGLCRECSIFSPAEHIVYATAELLSMEYENGILAMEFAAPDKAEVVLQLARRPVGPLLAAGKPADFDWDDKTLRARLPIPAGAQPGHRVRIGIAMEEPDNSAFFENAHRLLTGRPNAISTVYSSAELAARSRLRLPEGYASRPRPKSPNEIDYEVVLPPEAVPGDWANLALEADGTLLGRARLQLFRPATVRLPAAVSLHFGPDAELSPAIPTAVVEPRGGANVEVAIRNNSYEIQTYHLEATGSVLEFLPAKTDIAIGALEERIVTFRVFAKDERSAVRDWQLRVTGGLEETIPMRLATLPRSGAGAWSADLDGDGFPEWVLESRKARAIFSAQDGGRWIEFTWKDGDINFLPEGGLFAARGEVEIRPSGDALEFTGKGWKRSVKLNDASLSVTQDQPLPGARVSTGKRGPVALAVETTSPGSATYSLR